MRRGLLLVAAGAAVLTAVLSVIVNWATEIVTVPAWLNDPVRIVLFGAVVVLLLGGLGMVAQGQVEPPPAPAATPEFTSVAPSLRPPPPGPVFGRADELAALTATHRDPVLDVVCAGGGTGKTTLARELARQHGDRAFWIDWRNDPEVLATSMVEVARALGLAQEKVAHAQRTGASLPDLVWAHLGSVRGWLVVVDNVDDVDALQSGGNRISAYRGWLRPTASGQLLVTTRLQDAELWGPQARLHRIGRLSTADAAATLRNLAPHGGDAAEELADRLGGHPLALRAAGRAVGAATSAWPTFAAYLTALREQRISVLPDAPHETDPETARRLVGHTWEVSLDQLAAKPQTRLARPLLRALSLLARAPIPRGLITPALLPEPATEAQVNDALAGLDRYGLLEPAAPGTVLLHPLVRETSAAFLAEEADVAEWRERVEDRVTAFVEETAAHGRDGWNDARLLVPHVLGLHGLDLAVDGTRFHRARNTADTAAAQLRDAGAYAEELELRQRVLNAELRCLRAGSLDVLLSRAALGRALLALGEPAGAERQLRAALADARRDHPGHVLAMRSELAGALLEQGALDDAVEHMEDVHAALSTEHGPEHADTLTEAHNLARALSARGDHQRAVDIFRHNLEVETRVSGPEHADTLLTVDQLALALSRFGRHREAEELNTHNLERYERVLGPEHPRTSMSRHNLARERLALGEHSGAAELARLNVALRERVLGPDHPRTAASRALLAECEEAVAAATPLGRLRARLRR
ncbi:MAG: hypothetical protein QOK35_13 [Pseudonocardiales bacterium]|nr:hypothetical protein [Pseudonocardiales bacterium]